MRVRSRLSGVDGLPGRARTTKIQNNLVHLGKANDPNYIQKMLFLTELQALSNKTAKALATSLLRVFEEVQLSLSEPRRMVHLVVGSLVIEAPNQQHPQAHNTKVPGIIC